MTAHRHKPTITSTRIDWFARYYLVEPSWGVFHVALDDGNYELKAADQNADGLPRDLWDEGVKEAAEWFDQLTQAQRARLGRKAQARAKEIKVDESDVPWRRR